MSSPHTPVEPEGLPPARGFSHAMAAAPGRLLFLAGQAGHLPDGRLVGGGLVEQFAQSLRNLAAVLAAAGGRPEHLVSLQILVTDASAYRKALKSIGRAYREVLGSHYPAMALLEVVGLFDPAAQVEVVGVAVIPEG